MPSAVGLSSSLKGVRQDGAAVGEGAGEILGGESRVAIVDKSLIAVEEPVDFHLALGVVAERLHNGAHGGVECLAIAAAGKHSNSEHRVSSPWTLGFRRGSGSVDLCAFVV